MSAGRQANQHYLRAETCLNKQKHTVDLEQEVITIVKDATFTGFKEFHSYDLLKHQLVLHYILHIRMGLLGRTEQERSNKHVWSNISD